MKKSFPISSIDLSPFFVDEGITVRREGTLDQEVLCPVD